MKRSRLPLTALRSFESAGRLMSFSAAAEELFVSQAAISRQVRELEDLINVKLFERLHRRVTLTAAGSKLLAEVTASFDRIDTVLTDVRADVSTQSVKVSVEPTFASLWLFSKLDSFRKAYPDIEVIVEADHRVTDFRAGSADIAIRYGLNQTEWPRVESRFLQKVACTPLISSEQAKQHSFKRPQSILEIELLHEENRSLWNRWLALANLDEAQAQKGPVFPDGAYTLNAVRQGHGAIVGDVNMLSREIASGELVAPFDLCVECGAYFLVAPSLKRLRKPVAIFADWLTKTVELYLKTQ